MNEENTMRAGEGVLNQAAGLVTDAKADFDRLAANLNTQLLGAQSRWQGQGGSRFFQLAQAWDEKQRTIVGALDRFHTELTGTQTVFTGADEDAAAGANTNINRLGNVPS